MDTRDDMTHFPRLYENITCPLVGYEGYTLRVLLNPTGAEKEDWFAGNLGQATCEACAALWKASAAESGEREYCPVCTEARARMGRSAVAIYGQSQAAGLDFSAADAALASFEQPGLPDEFLAWLYWAPSALWAARTDDLKKKLTSPSPSAS